VSELPRSWTLQPLTDIAEVRLGRQRAPKNHSGDRMRPYLRAANVGWKGLLLDDVKTMNFTDAEMDTYRLVPGDLLLGEASGSPGEVGKPALWTGELEECAFQNTLIRVRAHGAEPRFLLHYFRFLALTGRFVEHSRGVGIHHIGRARLASWPTPVPPAAVQRRIIDILEDHLSRLDAACAYIGAATARLEAVRASVIASRVRSVSAPRKRLESVLVSTLSNGRSVPSRVGGFPVLRLTALKQGRIDLSERKDGDWDRDDAQRFLVKKGDFLVSRGNGSLRLVGRGGLVNEVPDGVAFPDTLIRIHADPELVHPGFLSMVWNSSLIRDQLEGMARTTAGIYKINQKDLASVLLPVPSVADQERIQSEVYSLMDGVRSVEIEAERARAKAFALRQALLAGAFAGRLTGHQSDLDQAEEVACDGAASHEP
jgi:type I restriction enzyme S subunit